MDADGECAGLRVRIRGEMQSDGFAQMTAVLKAARSGGSGGAACVLQDVQLVLPLVALALSGERPGEGAAMLLHALVLKHNPRSLVTWRTVFVAPIAEEWAFRACMCPLLLVSQLSLRLWLFVPACTCICTCIGTWVL